MNEVPCHILLVDDDPDDIELFVEAMQQKDANLKLKCIQNGQQALQWLVDQSELPCLIVLDLNMPGWDGRQTIQHIKCQKRLESIPIVVLTTAKPGKDQAFFDELGIDVMTKPTSVDGLSLTIDQLLQLFYS
jgi:two-component system, response regulator